MNINSIVWVHLAVQAAGSYGHTKRLKKCTKTDRRMEPTPHRLKDRQVLRYDQER